MSRPLKILTINIRGLKAREKQMYLKRYLNNADIDIVFIQETHFDSVDVTMQFIALMNEDFSVAATAGQSSSAGVLILVRKNSVYNVRDFQVVNSLNAVIVKGVYGLADLWLINIYAWTEGQRRQEQFIQLSDYVPDDVDCIIGGDFNCVLSMTHDRASERTIATYDNKGAAILQDIITAHSFVDPWTHSGLEKGYTWYGRGTPARLDRFYVPLGLAITKYNIYTDRCLVSDHNFVILHLCLNTPVVAPKKYSRWVMNTKVLTHEYYNEEINLLLEEYNARSSLTMYEWDIFKLEVKRITVRTTSRLKKLRERETSYIEKRLKEIEEFSEGLDDGTEYASLKSKLDEIEQSRREGAKIRARMRQVEANERISKAIYGIEQHRSSKRCIKALRNDGELLERHGEILDVITKFYQQLFGQVGESQLDDDFIEANVTHLHAQQHADLQTSISEHDIRHAIKALKNGKTPGSDGIPAEFYRKFQDKLVPLLCKVYANCVDSALMSPQMRKAVIVLIPKSEEPELIRDIKNWRPIALLNTDYKIYATILAARLKTIIHDIVSPQQVCGIPGRMMQDHIATMKLISESCEQGYAKAMWYNIDIQKAFDRVDRTYLWQVMRTMNIPEIYMQQLEVLYHGVVSVVACNGDLTDDIVMRRAIRQGCPTSCLLFAIYMEPLIRCVQQASEVHGYPIPNNNDEIKILGYADDVYFIMRDASSFHKVQTLLQQFCAVTDCRINEAKCTVAYWGDWAMTEKPKISCQLAEDSVKVLGVTMSTCAAQRHTTEMFWASIITKVQLNVQAWANRNLSVYARAKVWNTVIIAPIWHQMPWISLPNPIVRKLERIGALFIWGHPSIEFCRRTTLKLPIEMGGLAMCDIKCRASTYYYKYFYLMVNRLSTWQHIAYAMLAPRLHYLCAYGGQVIGSRLTPMHAVLLAVLRHFQDQVDVRDVLTNTWKSPYKQLVSLQCPRPAIVIDFGNRATTAVRMIAKSKIKPSAKTLSWRIVHACLPTGQWLAARRMVATEEAGCPICGDFEDLEHLFDRCVNAQRLQTEIERVTTLQVPSFTDWRFPAKRAQEDASTMACMQMHTTIWTARNKAKFENVQHDVIVLHALLWPDWRRALGNN